MAIVITPAEAPATVQRVIMLIYGQPGVGKTTAACTTDSPLLLDFDGGMHRALLRCPRVEVEKWSDVSSLNKNDLSQYSTIIVDTFGKAQQMLGQQITQQDRSAAQRNGEMTMQGWGALRRQFINWVENLTKMEKDVVLLAHSEEFSRGEETVERPMSQGRARNEIYQMADAIGLLNMVAGEIRLNFNLSDISIGKNSGALPAMTVPNPDNNPSFLGDVIRQMKHNINSRSAVSSSGDLLKELKERLQAMDSAASFQAEMQRMQQDQANSSERRMLVNVAKEKGFTLDRAQGVFVSDQQKAVDNQNTAPAAAATGSNGTTAAGSNGTDTTPEAEATETQASKTPAPAATTAEINGVQPAAAENSATQSTQNAEAERKFSPPPTMVEEPPPPAVDPFSNPESGEEDFDF